MFSERVIMLHMKDSYSFTKHYAIIPAAGVGVRMENAVAKQYLPLKNKTVLEHAIAPFLQHPSIEKLVICISPEDKQWQQLQLAKNPRIVSVYGANTRAESVLNGLLALKNHASKEDWVIVHDAVRPCLRFEDLEKFIDVISRKNGCHPEQSEGSPANADEPVKEIPHVVRDDNDRIGGLMAVPVRDTLKKASYKIYDGSPAFAEDDGTVDRNLLWCAQTPQMFRYDQLLKALQQADLKTITDEAQAIELMGEKPMIVMGRHDNIKITFPEDLQLAEKILC